MYRIYLSFGLLFLVSLSVSAKPVCEHDATTFRCVKFVRNYDGDTLTVNVPGIHPLLGQKISVRVRGVDTAEVRGKSPCEKDSARAARRLVESLLKNAKQIDLINVSRDKYFRILADVMLDGASLKDKLIKNNLAVLYDGGTKEKVNWCDMGQRLPAHSK